MDFQTVLDRYIRLFEQMTESDLATLDQVFTADAHFKDPFNDVKGCEKIRAIFQHMFDTLDAPSFSVDESVLGANIAYIRWQFSAKHGQKAVELTGVSRVEFTPAGLVKAHIDYWDASEQFYMKIPIIGAVLRFIQAKLRVFD